MELEIFVCWVQQFETGVSVREKVIDCLEILLWNIRVYKTTVDRISFAPFVKDFLC